MSMIIVPYIILNIISLALFGYDKYQAVCEEYRISERHLLLVAFFGPFGAYAGMRIFRHKIRKPLFSILVPVFIVIHAGIYALIVSGFL